MCKKKNNQLVRVCCCVGVGGRGSSSRRPPARQPARRRVHSHPLVNTRKKKCVAVAARRQCRTCDMSQELNL